MKKLLIVLVLSAALFGCKKSPKTGSGSTNTPQRNTMTCKINGEERVYSGKPTYLKDNGVIYYKRNLTPEEFSVFFIGDNSKSKDRIALEVFTWDIELNKKYALGTETKNYAEYIYNSAAYYKTQLNTGFVVFTQYSDNAIAGNFTFTAYTKDSQKVEVTDGYFNIDRTK